MDKEKFNEVDELYCPHKWTKRMSPEIALSNTIDLYNTSSEKVKNLKSLKCEFNLPYGYGEREKFDILGINLPEDSPVLIYIHGGYWQVPEITHTNQAFVASVLHKHNIKVITLGYELCPKVSVPDIIRNIQNGIGRILEYAKRLKSKGVYLAGHSAGAHLVASLFANYIPNLTKEDQKIIKSAFLICGIYDLTPLTQSVFINKLLNLDDKLAMESSPQHQFLSSGNDSRFHVIVAENDSPAFVAQGKAFHEKLLDLNIKSSYHFFEKLDHFNAIENLCEENYDLTKMIVKEMEESNKE